MGAKPNFLIITTDRHSPMVMRCYGHKRHSPATDHLAANGVRCTAGYVTAPQCAPARAGILTGLYQQRFVFETNSDLLATSSDLAMPLQVSEKDPPGDSVLQLLFVNPVQLPGRSRDGGQPRLIPRQSPARPANTPAIRLSLPR
ncbi:MAG: sulfatase-like hydrolase/transferase [Candidatus Sumerlaeota bacterium]|nr:sulfatase-like hydrolase/transferase [Candidatus Sumerlaeota bacterium]